MAEQQAHYGETQAALPLKKRAMSKTAHIREAGEPGVKPACPRRVHVREASIHRSSGARGRVNQTYRR